MHRNIVIVLQDLFLKRKAGYFNQKCKNNSHRKCGLQELSVETHILTDNERSLRLRKQ